MARATNRCEPPAPGGTPRVTRPSPRAVPSLRVVKNNPQSVSHPTPDPTHPVAEVHPINPTRSLHRPVAHRKNHSIALLERHDLRPRLHPWRLLGHHELAPSEIHSGPRQQYRHLQRKHLLPVEVLV